jgi:HEXXH motif-containing protein
MTRQPKDKIKKARKAYSLIDNVVAPEVLAEPVIDSPPTCVGPDTSGIIWPTGGGSYVDQLAARYAKGVADRAGAALISWGEKQTEIWPCHVRDRTANAVSMLTPVDRISAFSHAVASMSCSDSNPAEILETEVATLARFLVGAPGAPDLELALPVEAFGQHGLYFPHINMIVRSGGGPVAIRSNRDEIVFTWSDGGCVTAPRTLHRYGAVLGDGRAQVLPSVGGWTVMNGAPDFAAGMAEVVPDPSGVAEDDELAILREGIDLLHTVWPEAGLANSRILNSVLVQPQTGEHTTSITTGRLQGGLILSVRDPIQIGDAICHEGAHARMSLLFQVDSVIEDDGAEIHSSPWRSDKRPLKGLLNGVHSFVNVCEYYRRIAATLPEHAKGAEQILSIQRERLKEAWGYFAPLAEPTKIGRAILDELDAAVGAL